MQRKLKRRPTKHGKQLTPFSGKASQEELQGLRELHAMLKATQGITGSQMTVLVEAAKTKYPWYRSRVKELENETAQAEDERSATT